MKLARLTDTWTKRALLLCALLILIGFCCDPPKSHAASLWEATSLSVGGQGRWLYSGDATTDREFEGAANIGVGITHHVAITGGVAHGFQDNYTRSQADARITATDVNDQTFNIWIGAGRYWSKEPTDGLDEWAGKAGLGWAPLRRFPNIIFGLTSAYGFDTGRQSLNLSGEYAFKRGVR